VLTRRQLEILALYAQGMGWRQIASLLHIEPVTVQNHLAGIRRSLEVRTTSHAITVALARGELEVDFAAEKVIVPPPPEDRQLAI
jgi:DNA-binding NarL/FixJ family response regulator